MKTVTLNLNSQQAVPLLDAVRKCREHTVEIWSNPPDFSDEAYFKAWRDAASDLCNQVNDEILFKSAGFLASS